MNSYYLEDTYIVFDIEMPFEVPDLPCLTPPDMGKEEENEDKEYHTNLDERKNGSLYKISQLFPFIFTKPSQFCSRIILMI